MKNYRTFLTELLEELQDAVRVSENAGWHHQKESSEEYQCYVRLVTWALELVERRTIYDNARTRRAWKTLRRLPPGRAT